MATDKDYYQILGINPHASDVEIRMAYRKLARRYHPDLNPKRKSAEERFKRVQEAYDVLSELTSREEYDASRQNRINFTNDDHRDTLVEFGSDALVSWKDWFLDEFNWRRKLAVTIWALCSLGTLLPTNIFAEGLRSRLYGLALALVPLVMIWVGSGWSEENDLDMSTGSAFRSGFGIVLELIAWVWFARLVGLLFLGPLILLIS